MTVENIRLTPFEIDAICKSFQTYFAPEDHLWLFGSRVNPKARGGDIDLYIETTIPEVSAAVDKNTAFVIELYDKIGEQKIDVVLNLVTRDYKLAIYEVAREEGIQLV
jgi:hypothetical protein